MRWLPAEATHTIPAARVLASCDEYSDSGRWLHPVADYRGNLSTTVNGRTCQRWASSSPHGHGNTPESRPGTGLDGGHNYCRDPDGEG